MRFIQYIVQVGKRLCKKKKKRKLCKIEANIEYFASLNCCNLTFSQIQIIIKFLKSFVKEGLNLSQMVYLKDCLTVNVEYCGFFLAEHKYPQKIKTRITLKTEYIDISFQVANMTEI